MSMPELTDDQLDGLFRKSGEEFDTPFDPAAWQDMKARLDANDRTTPSGAFVWKNLLRWGLPLALLMLLIGGGWFIYRKANPGTTTTPLQKVAEARANENTIAKGVTQPETPRLAETQRPTERPASSPEHAATEIGSSANRAESAKESDTEISKSAKEPVSEVGKFASKPGSLKTNAEKPEMAKPVEITGSNRAVLAKTMPKTVVATKSIPSSYKLASGRNRAKRIRSGSEPTTAMNSEIGTNRLSSVPTFKSKLLSVRKLRKQRDRDRDLMALSATGYTGSPMPSFAKRPGIEKSKTAQSDGSAITGSPLAPESNETTSVLLPTINELAIRPAHWPKSLAFTGRAVEAQPDTTAQQVVSKPSIPVQRGFSVRFVVSPDLSSVGLKNFARPGTNVGLFLEYRLAKRWSIQIGAVQSTKVYRALSGEYGYLPPDLDKYKANLAEVAGRCNILDIPINLRYDIMVKPQKDGLQPTRWFISSGVTSYIMTQEDYTYTYYRYYPTNITDWSNPSPNGYGLSNLNLSVGYERSFSRRLSWQVEPFMKLPLKGVGVYKIDLLSTGAFFSLRYKL